MIKLLTALTIATILVAMAAARSLKPKIFPPVPAGRRPRAACGHAHSSGH